MGDMLESFVRCVGGGGAVRWCAVTTRCGLGGCSKGLKTARPAPPLRPSIVPVSVPQGAANCLVEEQETIDFSYVRPVHRSLSLCTQSRFRVHNVIVFDLDLLKTYSCVHLST